MNLTEMAIERRRVTYVAVVLLLLAGLLAFRSLPRAEDPGFVFRTAYIATAFPGASPQRVEELVTSRIEERVQELPELDFVDSVSSQGRSVVYVTLKDAVTDVRPVWDRLRRKIEAASRELPDGVIGPIVDDEFGDVFGILIAVTATDGFTDAEMTDVAEQLRDELLRLPEAAKVSLHGVQDRRIYVEFDNARLAELALSPLQLARMLQARNIIDPGGVVFAGPQQLALEPTGSYASVEDLRQTAVQLPNSQGEVLHLGDIATVVEGTVEPAQPKARANGERAIVVGVSLREGGNIGQLGADVQSVLSELRDTYPHGLELELVHFQPDDVDRDVSAFLDNLVQGVVIVVVVMMAFLGLRTGLVIASLIPMSMVATFLLMALFGVGIDTVSLAALLIALGMLVDNAIVMSEATMVGMAEGRSPRQAAVEAAIELRIPLLISSLTTAAAFLPIYLAQSKTGEYTAPLFLVVTMALLASWVLSLTAIPLFCVQLLRIDPADAPSTDTSFYRAYRGLLSAVLGWPRLTLLAATAALLASFALARLVEQSFFPPSAKPTFTVSLELAPGTTLAQTEAVVLELEAWMKDQVVVGEGREQGVVSWASFVGVGPPRFQLTFRPAPPSDDYAMLFVNASSTAARDALIPQFEAWLEANQPDVLAAAKPLSLGPPAGKPVAVRISAPTVESLFETADRVRTQLASIPGVRSVGDDWGMRTRKLDVRIDPARARLAGITHADIALSLQTALAGIPITQFREGDEITPVVLRARDASRRDIGRIDGLNMFVQHTGRPVPLKQVADVALTFQDGEIRRRNLAKTAEVSAEIEPGAVAADISGALTSWLEAASEGWPPGVRWEIAGEAEANARSRGAIRAKLPIAALIITLLLIVQFDSIRRASINLAVLPFGLVGVFIGLFLTGSTFGFMTLLGIISLFGIIINNANVLLDRIHIEQTELGLSPWDAVLEASQRRLRPILLTTGTTIGGLVPLWIGGGPMFRPMAVTLIFGLLFGTVLTLLLVPAMYAVAYRVAPRR